MSPELVLEPDYFHYFELHFKAERKEIERNYNVKIELISPSNYKARTSSNLKWLVRLKPFRTGAYEALSEVITIVLMAVPISVPLPFSLAFLTESAMYNLLMERVRQELTSGAIFQCNTLFYLSRVEKECLFSENDGYVVASVAKGLCDTSQHTQVIESFQLLMRALVLEQLEKRPEVQSFFEKVHDVEQLTITKNRVGIDLLLYEAGISLLPVNTIVWPCDKNITLDGVTPNIQMAGTFSFILNIIFSFSFLCCVFQSSEFENVIVIYYESFTFNNKSYLILLFNN